MMSTPSVISTAAQSVTRPANGSGVVPYRVSVRQFEKMIGAGVFGEHDHIELLEGILVDKMTKNDPHDFTVDATAGAFRGIVSPDWVVREEKSVVLDRFSRPEPDVTVARAPRERYRSVAPKAADPGMLIEVADASYAKGRGSKWRMYVRSRIPIYWIVNLPLRRIKVYTQPAGRGKSAAYQVTTVYAADDEVPVILGGREVGRLKVSDVLS
jgi:Uma2 family endonuclease